VACLRLFDKVFDRTNSYLTSRFLHMRWRICVNFLGYGSKLFSICLFESSWSFIVFYILGVMPWRATKFKFCQTLRSLPLSLRGWNVWINNCASNKKNVDDNLEGQSEARQRNPVWQPNLSCVIDVKGLPRPGRPKDVKLFVARNDQSVYTV
jgi:hypothetical protein